MERAVLRKMTSLCAVFGLCVLVLLGTTTVHDGNREWKQYQEEYQARLLEKVDQNANPILYERVATMKPEVKQIVVEGLETVDRCTTCHLGIDDPLFADAMQPLKTHPNFALLETHPVKTFGCTICHGGQGTATTFEGASHQTITHWPDPMVDEAFMQSRCGYCHTNYEAIKADKMLLGQKLFKDLHCSGCHKVNPGDGSMAPVLSNFADKDSGHFDFTHIEGEHSRQNWVLEHFRDPQKVSPGSPMRIYAMNDEQVDALTTYVLSLSEKVFPLNFYTKADMLAIK